MDCRETQALLTAFHDGELPAADSARVEGHLQACTECGALLADLARAEAAKRRAEEALAQTERGNVEQILAIEAALRRSNLRI